MIGSIEVRTRPIRLAFLVDPNHAAQILEAIRLGSSLWGGIYFPIIPLFSDMPPEWADLPLSPPPARKVILGYLEAFDPDVLVNLSASSLPDFITGDRRELVSGSDIWSVLNTPRPLVPRFGIGVFEIFRAIFDECFKYKAKYPVRVILPQFSDEFSLFWASIFGELPPNLMPLVERFREQLEIELIPFSTGAIADLMEARIIYPRRLVDWALEGQARGGIRERGSVFYLDAARPDDIIDLWNLRALGRSVLALPKQFQELPVMRDLTIRFLRAHHVPWPHNPSVYDAASFIRSRHSSMEEMQAFAQSLDIGEKPAGPHDSFFTLQHWYPRVWDEWGSYKDGAVPDDLYLPEKRTYEIGESTGVQVLVKTTLPDFAEEFGYHNEPRCANDLTFHLFGSDSYVADILPEPAGDRVIDAVGGAASLPGEWRIGRGSLVRLINHNTTDFVAIPLAEDVMVAWLTDLGWKPQMSSAGLLTKRMFRQIEGNVYLLRNEKLLGLLEHMNGGKVGRDGSPAKDNRVQSELERNLTINEVKQACGGSYDYLLSRGVFRLGSRIRCPNCQRRSWFAVNALGDMFTCPRCSETFGAIGALPKGVWTYTTSGPFSVPGYADGAYAVLLTIDFFGERKMHALRTTPLVSFTATASARDKLEADFAILWQQTMYGDKTAGVIVGECKTYAEFEARDFARVRDLAKAFPGAILVFSTLRRSLNPGEIGEISVIAKEGRRHRKADSPVNPVLILTGTELLHWQPPPYCWSGDVRQRFDRVNGILEICDASQQIYLGLSSWHQDWHEEWERKRAEMAARSEA